VGRENGGGADRYRIDYAEQMCAPIGRSIVRDRAVDHGGDAVEHKTNERKYYQCEVQRQQQDHHNSRCGERLTNGDGSEVTQPISDPATSKLASGAADKDQRQSESRGSDSRALLDQQEWQAHEKAASYDAVRDAKQRQNVKAEAPGLRIALAARASGKLGRHCLRLRRNPRG